MPDDKKIVGISSEEATTVVAKAIYAIFGNDGPKPTAGPFFKVRTEAEDVTEEDYLAIQTLTLANFAAQDGKVIDDTLLDRLWDKIIAGLKDWWDKANPGYPFPSVEPARPEAFNDATTVGDLVSQILEWSDAL